ncbi:unnamed protein product [Rodentolepis nana]|uniref:SIT4 phosphatase-associated family protein n=1 Tax=Rodentolepis nana TaxID=102285 RepID=A0A0R3TE37_RODNA|nr:unnamed protein product [Rodentolepis nana]
MSSDRKQSSGLGVRFTTSYSDEVDASPTIESSNQHDATPRSRAFANFFEEFERESDGMSQTSQLSRGWQQAIRESFDQDCSHRVSDSSGFYNNPGGLDPCLCDDDEELLFMDRYGGFSQSFHPQSCFSDVRLKWLFTLFNLPLSLFLRDLLFKCFRFSLVLKIKFDIILIINFNLMDCLF